MIWPYYVLGSVYSTFVVEDGFFEIGDNRYFETILDIPTNLDVAGMWLLPSHSMHCGLWVIA